ncbi:hypothetical protein V8E54_006296 [Elaphomyces granulatus]
MPLLHLRPLVPRRKIERGRKLFTGNQKPEWPLSRRMRRLHGPARIELLKRKSRPSATAVMPKQRPLMTLKFPGLKRDLIKSIRQSKFIPRMLFKLRYAQGVNADRRTQEVLIQDGKIEVATKDYLKDYGRTPTIWTEGFVNYTAISVFGAEFPGLHIGLSRFMLDIIELEKIYDWQTAVLPLALQFLEELADDGLCSDPHQWTLDRQYVDRFCNATRLKNARPNQSLADSVSKGITPTPRRYPTEPNDPSVICRKWNTPESCHWAACRRRHERLPAGQPKGARKRPRCCT